MRGWEDLGTVKTAAGTVADLAVGDVLRIRENGGLAGWTVIAKGAHGTGENDALCLRVSLLAPCTYFFGSAEYENSTVDRWLSHGYLHALSDAARAALVPAALPCWDEFNKQSKSITRLCFLLSATELGFVDAERIAVEGTAIPYFAGNAQRAASYFGDPAPYGTRSPMKSSMGGSVHIISVGPTGEQLSHPVLLYTLPVRPAVIVSGAAALGSNNEII